jgi:hypothetical protein
MLKFLAGKKNENYRYKLTLFLICLAISTLVWMLIKLSESYSSHIFVPIVYDEIPEGKILVNKIDTTLKIGITERGFALAWLKYFSRREPFQINLEEQRLLPHMHQYVALVNTEQWSQNFLNQFDLNGKVDYILPDTLAFYFEDRYSKQVPVRSNAEINYRKQFFAYDSLTIKPRQVNISGLYKTISEIDFLTTEPVTYQNLSTAINETIPLQKPANSPDILIEPNEVHLQLRVEKFTESQIDIPITTINQPENARIKIFPESVSIKYLVALIDFKEINQDLFICTVDLSVISKTNKNKLDVTLSNFPPNIKIISIDPAEVDFLVLK